MTDGRKTKRALIVDDASIMRSMLKKVISAQGFDCIEATNGQEAIETYHAQRPDLVTLDVHIDELSGMSVLQVLRNIDPDARIVIVSVESDRAIIAELVRQGAKAFVAKPFEPEILEEAIARALE